MDLSYLKEELECELEEGEDDQDAEMEEDLCEAREHLENCLRLLNKLVVADKVITRRIQKECIDMAIDVSGFLDQWETEEGGM